VCHGKMALGKSGSPISQPVSRRKILPGVAIHIATQHFCFSRALVQSRPFSRCLAAKQSRQSPIRIKRVGRVAADSPWQCRTAPEKRWCRPASQWLTESVAADIGSTPCWLAFQAIASIAPAAVQGVQSDLVAFNPTPGLARTAPPLIVTRNSVSH
jgi:hypothetical protein